jgi:hypothetical protein
MTSESSHLGGDSSGSADQEDRILAAARTGGLSLGEKTRRRPRAGAAAVSCRRVSGCRAEAMSELGRRAEESAIGPAAPDGYRFKKADGRRRVAARPDRPHRHVLGQQSGLERVGGWVGGIWANPGWPLSLSLPWSACSAKTSISTCLSAQPSLFLSCAEGGEPAIPCEPWNSSFYVQTCPEGASSASLNAIQPQGRAK